MTKTDYASVVYTLYQLHRDGRGLSKIKEYQIGIFY